MKMTVFYLEEKFLWWTTDCSTILVVVQSAEDRYEVFVTVNHKRIEQTVESYSTQEYAMLAYSIAADRVRKLVKECNELDDLIAQVIKCK